ncbi:MAG: cofactor-independent phosphoglycerate mutase [Dysgonamonadaceae bacterium]|nr:cofactor-independent phosphoglycerate mutase [Dysgonamonadaceae bacterium]
MKYLIILGDGMADWPIASLGNRTPLQYADTPHFDQLATMGCSGLLDTIPEGLSPGSEIANLSVLGYDVPEVFEGRGALEAASMGVAILPNEIAMRCNLICIEDGKIKNHSAGHISSEEASQLIDFLNETLADDRLCFFPGVSYRHLLKLKDGNKRLLCTPPHDAVGVGFEEILIRPQTADARATAELLNDVTRRSQELLKDHPVNRKRVAEGKDPANSIWLWSPGNKPRMRTLPELFPIKSGVVISAVDLINGIGVYAGLQVVKVEGATGLYDTNYEGKARAALEALKTHDFVYLHVEASDEAGHEGNVALKIRTIEDLDRRVLKPILETVCRWNEPVAIALLPDHPTPCATKTHTSDPVPFVIFRPGDRPDSVTAYDEFSAQKGSYGLLRGGDFIKKLIDL